MAVPVDYGSTGAPATINDITTIINTNLDPELKTYRRFETDIIKNQEVLEDLKHNENIYNNELIRITIY